MRTIYSIFFILLISACSGSASSGKKSSADKSSQEDTTQTSTSQNETKADSKDNLQIKVDQNQEYFDIGRTIFQYYINREIDSVYNYFPTEDSWRWVFKQINKRLQDYEKKKHGIRNILNEEIQGDETREIDNKNLKIDSVKCSFVKSKEQINLNKTTVFFTDGKYRLEGEVLLYTFNKQKFLYPLGGIKYQMTE